jgi:hypothetical protein
MLKISTKIVLAVGNNLNKTTENGSGSEEDSNFNTATKFEGSSKFKTLTKFEVWSLEVQSFPVFEEQIESQTEDFVGANSE